MSLNPFEFTVRGIKVQAWEGGRGPSLMLLHGSGPGAASLGTWRHLFEPLMERFHVYCMDLIGFGQSGRKPQEPYFDLDLWQEQAQVLLAIVPGDKVRLVGHSISGLFALRLAAQSPRIARLMTTATIGASFPVNEGTRLCWTFPETKEDLRRTLQALTFDHSGITEEMLDARMAILHDGVYGGHFSSMFAGDRQRFIEQCVITPEELAQIRCDVMMVHGLNDGPFPAGPLTLSLARHLPQADILLLARCGHLPALEQPGKLTAAMLSFFA